MATVFLNSWWRSWSLFHKNNLLTLSTHRRQWVVHEWTLTHCRYICECCPAFTHFGCLFRSVKHVKLTRKWSDKLQLARCWSYWKRLVLLIICPSLCPSLKWSAACTPLIETGIVWQWMLLSYTVKDEGWDKWPHKKRKTCISRWVMDPSCPLSTG